MVGLQEPEREKVFACGKNSCWNLKTNSQPAQAIDFMEPIRLSAIPSIHQRSGPCREIR